GRERQGMAVLQRAERARAAPRATSRNQSDDRCHGGWPARPRKEGHRQAVTRLRPVQNRSRLRRAAKPKAYSSAGFWIGFLASGCGSAPGLTGVSAARAAPPSKWLLFATSFCIRALGRRSKRRYADNGSRT